ncbi:MAG: hypothetical protein EBU36_03890 [Verrucomicrobia bacterium]|jgi:hypothetical protein|nr:hypothetical protein [Verrucomicrobiota bacterium]
MGMSQPSPESRARLRPRLYGVALYLVAGILFLQLMFCLSVFFLRPYASSKTPEGIIQSEREKAGQWWSGWMKFLQSRGHKDAVEPRLQSVVPAKEESK